MKCSILLLAAFLIQLKFLVAQTGPCYNTGIDSLCKNSLLTSHAQVSTWLDSVVKARSEKEGPSLLSVLPTQRNYFLSKPASFSSIATTETYNRQTDIDFSKIITTELSSASPIRYATLKIDDVNARAVFIPFNYTHKVNFTDGTSLTNYSVSAGVDVSIDNKGIFNIVSDKKLNRDFSGLINLNFHLKSFNRFKPMSDRDYNDSLYLPLKQYNDCLLAKYSKVCCSCDEDKDLQQKYRDDFFGKETALIEQLRLWARYRQWISISANAGGKLLTGFDTITRNTVDLNYFNYGGGITYNIMRLKDHPQSWLGFGTVYFSMGVKGSIVNTFSQTTANDWYRVNKFSDSAQTIVDEKGSVYLYNSAAFQRKFMPSVYAQLIAMKKLGSHFNLGLDLFYQQDYLLPEGGQNIVKQYGSIGFIFPFKDADGKTSINIELFWGMSKFTDNRFAGQNTVGVKFSVPILSQ